MYEDAILDALGFQCLPSFFETFWAMLHRSGQRHCDVLGRCEESGVILDKK